MSDEKYDWAARCHWARYAMPETEKKDRWLVLVQETAEKGLLELASRAAQEAVAAGKEESDLEVAKAMARAAVVRQAREKAAGAKL